MLHLQTTQTIDRRGQLQPSRAGQENNVVSAGYKDFKPFLVKKARKNRSQGRG